jgi:hypothetical protein
VSYQNCPRPPSWDDTLASLCAERGLVRYVSELLDEGLSMHQGPNGRPLLDFVVQDKPRYFNDGIDPPSRIAMCAMLLERGANPNEMFKGRTVWENVLGYVRHEVPTSFLEATPPKASKMLLANEDSSFQSLSGSKSSASSFDTARIPTLAGQSRTIAQDTRWSIQPAKSFDKKSFLTTEELEGKFATSS